MKKLIAVLAVFLAVFSAFGAIKWNDNFGKAPSFFLIILSIRKKCAIITEKQLENKCGDNHEQFR